MSSNIRRDSSRSMQLRVANNFGRDATKKPPKINFRDDQSLVSFLDFLYKLIKWLLKVLIFVLVDLERFFLTSRPCRSLGRRPLKLTSLALKTASIENLREVDLKQRLVGLSELHPTLPKRLLAATCILATYNKVACEQQTHFRSSLLSILRRERSDDRKCVCCSQANNKVTPKTKNRTSAEDSLKIEFHGMSPQRHRLHGRIS